MTANSNTASTAAAPAPIPDADLLAHAERCRAQLTGPGAPFEVERVQLMGQDLPAYRNAFKTLPELLNAGRVHADREFMVYEGESWSFARFYAAVDALAGRLQTELGLGPGDRVAIAMRNRPDWAVAFVAIALTGAVPVPLNSFGLREELLDNLNGVAPRCLICDAERHGHVAADLDGLGCRALVVDDAPEWGLLLAAGGPALKPPELGGDDSALILFTSGASTRAKGVLSTHRAVCQALFNMDYIGALSGMTSPEIVARMMARGLQPTTLMAVPLFHVSGLHAQLLTSLRNGRRLVFMRRWDPALALQLVQTQRITQFNGAPAMVQQLLAQPGFDDPELTGTLMGLGFGGAGLPQRVIDEVLTRRADSMSGVGFGMTESNGVCAGASGRLFMLRPQASGLLSPIIELRVADLDGSEQPTGEAGEILLRGVTVMQRYWGEAEATTKAMRRGWLHTGDIGVMDADGYLRVVDRIKDVINRNGEKIAAAEIESCLLQHPQVLEAAVFSRPDELTGEAVVAVVVSADRALSADVFQAYVAQRLAAYKVPADVHVRHEPLPRNPAGKMLKSGLKREYLVG